MNPTPLRSPNTDSAPERRRALHLAERPLGSSGFLDFFDRGGGIIAIDRPTIEGWFLGEAYGRKSGFLSVYEPGVDASMSLYSSARREQEQRAGERVEERKRAKS